MYYNIKEVGYEMDQFNYDTLLSKIPDGDFIAVFGTSHTAGCCEIENGKYTHIKQEYTWSHQVTQALNMSYVNFAVPGNTNQIITQQIIEFLELPNVKERCKLVLVEARFGDISGEYWFDLFADYYNEGHGACAIPKIHLLGGAWEPSWRSKISGQFVPKAKKDYATELVRSCNPDDFGEYVPEPAVEQMQQIIEVYCKKALSSCENMVRDLLEIRTMRALCESNNIPFKYFMWDMNKISYSSVYYSQIKEVLDALYDIERNSIKNLYPNVNEVGPKILGTEVWDTTDCECGHRNHVVHEFVANEIIEELRNDFRS